MKKFIITGLALTLVLALTQTAVSQQEVSVTIDGVYVEFPDQQPVIVDSRTLVPVRGVFEQLGFAVYWEIDTPQTATLVNDYHTVHITIGSNTFNVNGENYILDVPAQLIGARTMLPIRNVLEAVGLNVDWDAEAWTVIISCDAARPAYITIRDRRFSTALIELNLLFSDLTDEDIVPLRYMTNLRSLNLDHNQIDDITPLTGLINLEVLSLSFNQIGNLTPLAELTDLTFLRLRYNRISNVSPLTDLTNLTQLELDGNQISDITPLTELTELRVLLLSNNLISDITPLTELTNLLDLMLSDNLISDITPLSDLVNLHGLMLNNNQINNIAPLAGLQNLTWLHLINNPITDWSPVAHVENIIGRP